jgi:hypothetical protein
MERISLRQRLLIKEELLSLIKHSKEEIPWVIMELELK